MEKTITVYIVIVGDKHVNYPTRSQAEKTCETLDKFGIESTIEQRKKTITIE